MSALHSKVTAYTDRTPTQIVEALKVDMQDPAFNMLAMLTFNDAKYFLKPAAFLKYFDAQPAADQVVCDLTPHHPVIDVLEAMSSGEISGNAAKEALTHACHLLSKKDQDLILMVLEKTWRNGVTQNTINLAVPNTFRPIKLMLAKKFNERQAHDDKLILAGKTPKIEWPRVSTVKYDGFRAAYLPSVGKGLSRGGNPFFLQQGLLDALAFLSKELAHWWDLAEMPAIDGELFNGGWKATAEARASDVGYDHLVIITTMPEGCAYGEKVASEFDVQEFFDKCDQIITGWNLEKWLSIPEYRIVNTPEEEEAHFRECLSKGWEGTISRPLLHGYVSGRSDTWLKNKAEEFEDLEIVGTIMADERSRNAGLVGAIEVTRNGIVSGCHGMSDALRKQATELGEDLHGLVAEVAYHELTPDGKLRHGVIKKIRFDKEKS